MRETVEHTTKVIGGKEYAFVITRQEGLQEIETPKGRKLVESVTILESSLGRSLCYTVARPAPSPEEVERNRRNLQEVCAKALYEQGLW
ncbi:hypothetical protein AALC17_05290 [Oscillospiraceae bacterium 38-13]